MSTHVCLYLLLRQIKRLLTSVTGNQDIQAISINDVSVVEDVDGVVSLCAYR